MLQEGGWVCKFGVNDSGETSDFTILRLLWCCLRRSSNRRQPVFYGVISKGKLHVETATFIGPCQRQFARKLLAEGKSIVNSNVQGRGRGTRRLRIGGIVAGEQESVRALGELRLQNAFESRRNDLHFSDDQLLRHGGRHICCVFLISQDIISARIRELVEAVNLRERRREHEGLPSVEKPGHRLFHTGENLFKAFRGLRIRRSNIGAMGHADDAIRVKDKVKCMPFSNSKAVSALFGSEANWSFSTSRQLGCT